MPGGRKSARCGRVDYKKLSSGETDWREEDVNIVQNTPAKGRKNKSRESIDTSTVETYLLMLYVTLEQEKALKEIFQNRKWPFLKPDLSSLTDKTGPTALNHRPGSKVNKPDVHQSNNKNNNNNGSAQDDPDDITDNVAESQEQPTEVNDDVIGDSDMEGIDNDELDDNVDKVEVHTPPQSTSKKRKLSNSPAVSSPKRKAGSAKMKAGKTKGEVLESGKKSEEPKVDGTDNDTNKGTVPGPTKYRSYSLSDMTEAYQAVREKKMAVKTAARLYGVPQTTLRDRVHGKIHPETTTSGPGTIFTQQEEQVFVDHFKSMSEQGHAYSRSEVINQASSYAVFLGKRDEDHPLSDRWYRSFMDRWPELKKVKRRSVVHDKAQVTSEDNVSSYLDVLLQNDPTNKPELVDNVDEEGIGDEN